MFVFLTALGLAHILSGRILIFVTVQFDTWRMEGTSEYECVFHLVPPERVIGRTWTRRPAIEMVTKVRICKYIISIIGCEGH